MVSQLVLTRMARGEETTKKTTTNDHEQHAGSTIFFNPFAARTRYADIRGSRRCVPRIVLLLLLLLFGRCPHGRRVGEGTSARIMRNCVSQSTRKLGSTARVGKSRAWEREPRETRGKIVARFVRVIYSRVLFLNVRVCMCVCVCVCVCVYAWTEIVY